MSARYIPSVANATARAALLRELPAQLGICFQEDIDQIVTVDEDGVVRAFGPGSAPGAASTITLSAGGAVTQTATIQLKDALGANLAAVRKIQAFMVTDASGATPSSAGAAVGVTATTGAIITALEAKLNFDIVTDANGVAVLEFDNTGGGGVYTDRVALVLPDGSLVVSAALATAVA